MKSALAKIGTIVALALLLAGCAKAPPAPAQVLGTEAADVETAPLQGLVVSDELIPLAGASVEVLGSPHRAIADQAGAFSFDELPIGDQTLQATAEGYIAKKVTVRVGADPASRLEIVLKTMASKKPYVLESFTFAAYSYYAYNVTNPATGETVTWSSYQIGNRRDQFRFRFDLGWQELFLELEWEPSTAIADQQLLQVGLPAGGTPQAPGFPIRFGVQGGSPLAWRLDADAYNAERAKDPTIRPQPDADMVQGTIRPSNPSGRPVSFHVAQDVLVYGSAAYNAPLPPGYSRAGEGK